MEKETQNPQQENIKMEIIVSSKGATKNLENAVRAAEKLQKALDALKEIEIGVEVVKVKKSGGSFGVKGAHNRWNTSKPS